MKFTTDTTTLKYALTKLGYGINSKSVLPILSCIHVEITPGAVEFTSSDIQVTIQYAISCTTDGEGKFLLPFAQLKNIVALESGDVSVEWVEGKGAVVSFAKDVFCLGNHGKEDEFPKTPKVADKHFFEIGNLFVDALKKASISTHKDELKPALCAICLEIGKDKSFVVSTDANSLYVSKLHGIDEVTDTEEILLQSVIAKIIEGNSGPLKIGYNSKNVAFKCNSQLVVTSRRLDVKYPNWRAVVPDHVQNLSVNFEELETAVAKAFVMSDSNTNGIELNISEKSMQVKSHDKDSGASSDITVDVESSSPVQRIQLNGRLLKRMFSQLYGSSSTKLNLMVTGPNKAVTVQSETDEDVTVLIMPIVMPA